MERRPSHSPGKASLTRVQGSRPTPAIGCNFAKKKPSMKLKIEPAVPVILQKTPYPSSPSPSQRAPLPGLQPAPSRQTPPSVPPFPVSRPPPPRLLAAAAAVPPPCRLSAPPQPDVEGADRGSSPAASRRSSGRRIRSSSVEADRRVADPVAGVEVYSMPRRRHCYALRAWTRM